MNYSQQKLVKTENVSLQVSEKRPQSRYGRKDKSPASVISRFSGNISAGVNNSVNRLSSKFLIRKPQTQANSNFGTPSK